METTRRLPIRETVGAAYAIVAKAPFRMLGLAAVPLGGLALLLWAAFALVEPVAKGAFYLVYVMLAGYVLQYALFILIIGALVQGAARVDRKAPFGLRSAVAAGLRRLPQSMGASWYVFVMGTTLFYGLFSTPPSHIEYALPVLGLGVAGAVLLVLSLPVCLIERRGPIASMARALRLARDNRWRLFASVLIATAPIIGLTILLVMVVAAYLFNTILAALAFMAMSAVLAALSAAAYDRLVPPENAAVVVFD